MNKKKAYVVLATALILLIPYVTGAPWTLSDYIIAAVLLLSTGLTLEVVTSRIKDNQKKMLVGLGILFVAVYIWAELAVGIFTTLGS